MALIDYVTEDNATGRAREYYEQRSRPDADDPYTDRYSTLRDRKGRSLFAELRLHNPSVLEAQRTYSRTLWEIGPVDDELFEIVMVAVAQANDCDYCAGSHRENLDLLLGLNEDTIRSIADGDFDGLPERERVVASFARRCIEDPHRIGETDIERLTDVGFDEADLIQLLAVIGHCNSANLVVNTLNAHPADLDREFRY